MKAHIQACLTVVIEYVKEFILLDIRFWNYVSRFNRDNGSIATSCLRMAEEDLEVCEDGLLCECKCNMNNKQLKKENCILTRTECIPF